MQKRGKISHFEIAHTQGAFQHLIREFLLIFFFYTRGKKNKSRAQGTRRYYIIFFCLCASLFNLTLDKSS